MKKNKEIIGIHFKLANLLWDVFNFTPTCVVLDA